MILTSFIHNGIIYELAEDNATDYSAVGTVTVYVDGFADCTGVSCCKCYCRGRDGSCILVTNILSIFPTIRDTHPELLI